jgi:hypothetical protein
MRSLASPQRSSPPCELRLLLLAAAAQSSHAWVPTAWYMRDYNALTLEDIRRSKGAVNRIWSLPPEVNSLRGLGGGITFAYDHKICDDLLPAMSESIGLWGMSFVDCGTVFAAIRAAFASWSHNHPLLNFHDVTADCIAENNTEGGPFGRGCSRAEIFLTTTGNSSAQDAAATTLNVYEWDTRFYHPNGIRASGGVWSTVGSIVAFTTSSFKAEDSGEPRSGVCWYIDATFCSFFHRLKAEWGAENVLLVGKILLFTIWSLGLTLSCTMFRSFLLKLSGLMKFQSAKANKKLVNRVKSLIREYDKDMDGDLDRDELERLIADVRGPDAKPFTERQMSTIAARFTDKDGNSITGERLQKTLAKLIIELDKAQYALSEEGSMQWKLAFDNLSKFSLAPIIATLGLIVVPVIFYAYIFLPCWDCYDFTAAATHEIGHVLGLMHPDASAELGLNLWYRRDNLSVHLAPAERKVNCTEPWSRVGIWPNSTEALDAIAASGDPAAMTAKRMLEANEASAGVPSWGSVMATFTFNNPGTCIFQDDLDALNVLYPTCEEAVLLPQCDHAQTFLGLVRLSMYVGLPVITLLLSAIMLHALSKKCSERSRERFKKKNPDLLEGNQVEANMDIMRAHKLAMKGKQKAAQRVQKMAQMSCSASSRKNVLQRASTLNRFSMKKPSARVETARTELCEPSARSNGSTV